MAVITISRQFGGGGRTAGEMAAKKLDYLFFDDQIIQMIAARAKVAPTWVKLIEKEAGGILQRFISRVGRRGFIKRISDEERGYIDEEIYVDLLRQTITQIAARGNVVILGRGGQYILQDRADTYHVLLVADRRDRIRFMQRQYRLAAGRAQQIVDRQEKRRVNLYRKFGRDDYDLPRHYHLMINTSKLSLEQAVGHICRLVAT